MNNNSDNIQRVIGDLNRNYADIFRNIVEGTRLFRSMTLSDDHNVENSIAASLIESGWLDLGDEDNQGRERLLINEAEYIVTALSHERTLLNYLNPGRITQEMRTSIFRVITNIMNWIQNHSTDENNSSRSSSYSSSSNSINSQSDQGSYSGEEPDIEDVARIGESDSEASGFDTPVQSDDDVDSESTDIDERLPYNAHGGKSKKAHKSKKANKSKMTYKLKKANKLKGGKSKMTYKSKKTYKSKMARKSKKAHKSKMARKSKKNNRK